MNKNEMALLVGVITSLVADITMMRSYRRIERRIRDERIAERKVRYEKFLNKHNQTNSFSKEESESWTRTLLFTIFNTRRI